MGQPMGRRISGLAYRVLMHQHEASQYVDSSTVAVWTIFSHITPMRLHSQRAIWDTTGASTGSMSINFDTAREQVEGCNPSQFGAFRRRANPLAYRFFCLQSHYRKPLEFSFDALDNAVAAYNKIAKRVAELKDEGDIDETAFADFKKKFTDAVSNDLNTSMAITIVYDVLKADISDRTKLALIDDFEQVLDLGLRESGKALLEASSSVDSELEAFINDKIAMPKRILRQPMP